MDPQDEFEHVARQHWDALVDSVSSGGIHIVRRSVGRLDRETLEALVVAHVMDLAVQGESTATPESPE
jgi:hypothetical protein